jgi:hypothetical protein
VRSLISASPTIRTGSSPALNQSEFGFVPAIISGTCPPQREAYGIPRREIKFHGSIFQGEKKEEPEKMTGMEQTERLIR